METSVYEIAPEIYRLSTFIPEAGIVFNQFLIDDDQPVLFHTGMKALFPHVLSAMERVMDPLRLRWITFGHYEADECGAMNSWLAVAPQSEIAHGALGVMVSIRDQADRPPRPLGDGELLEIGAKRLRYIATPHVPHGWDAGLYYEETTHTLFGGDLFTCLGNGPEVTFSDIVGPAFDAEDRYRSTALTPQTEPTLRFLSGLDIDTLALMHAPAFRGDASQALADLANGYAERFAMSGGA